MVSTKNMFLRAQRYNFFDSQHVFDKKTFKPLAWRSTPNGTAYLLRRYASCLLGVLRPPNQVIIDPAYIRPGQKHRIGDYGDQ